MILLIVVKNLFCKQKLAIDKRRITWYNMHIKCYDEEK